jgi:hypothetical protein
MRNKGNQYEEKCAVQPDDYGICGKMKKSMHKSKRHTANGRRHIPFTAKEIFFQKTLRSARNAWRNRIESSIFVAVVFIQFIHS